MQKLILIALLSIFPTLSFAQYIEDDCSLNTAPLYGRVQVVEYDPDFRVATVEHGADLRVQFVKHDPTMCGEWQIVHSNPDITVRFTDYKPDFTIERVSNNPGLN